MENENNDVDNDPNAKGQSDDNNNDDDNNDDDDVPVCPGLYIGLSVSMNSTDPRSSIITELELKNE